MIDKFRGEWTRLSNYSLVSVWFDGHIYPSVEHAYQAAKTLNENERQKIRNLATPNMAKKAGRQVVLRHDWELIKIPIMRQLLIEKFSQKPERDILISTGNEELVEGNWWGDTFWGMCNGKGQNNLGLLLMGIRELIRGGELGIKKEIPKPPSPFPPNREIREGD
jgi:ribA/ribD-fused uncharacterized protein